MPHRIRYVDPLHAGRHPFQTYLLVLCVLSGVPQALGREQAAPSIANLLPDWVAVAWGFALTLGAMLALFGSQWPATDPVTDKHGWYRISYPTALTLEKIGLITVGPAAVLYGVAIALYAYTGSGSLITSSVAALIILGFGVACLSRAHDLSRVLGKARKDLESKP